MKLNFSIKWLLAFLALIFLIIECHDWIHYITGRIICGCWGTKGFEFWKFCDTCEPDKIQSAVILLSGPVVNYLLIWTGWGFMYRNQPTTKKSLGFFLLYASAPLPRILAAISGGTDETNAFRALFQHENGSNRHWVALSALLMILILTVPPIIRSIGLISGWLRRGIIIPLFLIVPMYLDKWVVSSSLSGMLDRGFLSDEALFGTPWLVFAWLSLVLFVFVLTARGLLTGLEKVKRLR